MKVVTVSDQQTDRVLQDNPPVPTVIVGAWKEALGQESAFWRVYLTLFVAVTTIPLLPLWAALWGLQSAGFYHADKGWKLP